MATKSMFELSDDENESEVDKTAEKEKIEEKETGEDNFSDDDDDFCAAIEDVEESNVNEGEQAEDNTKKEMSKAEKDRAERNRLKALTLKRTRVLARPNTQGNIATAPNKAPKLVDSGGGFFIEEDEEGVKNQANAKFVENGPAPVFLHERPECMECEKKFDDSYLLRHFDYSVCDNCREMGKDGDHELITKTEAKTTFLLKDFELEKTEHSEALKFIVKKNPHNKGKGDMKLYLRLQVEQRAVEVWGSQEALEAEIESREEKKVELKSRKYNRQLKALRMAARSSLYKKDISAHVHQYQDEVYHEDKDEYSQTCATCGHINTYEKM